MLPNSSQNFTEKATQKLDLGPLNLSCPIDRNASAKFKAAPNFLGEQLSKISIPQNPEDFRPLLDSQVSSRYDKWCRSALESVTQRKCLEHYVYATVRIHTYGIVTKTPRWSRR